MDTAPLVDEQIEDGRRLIEQLVRDDFDVTLAFWVRFKSEADGPWFYIASKAVDQEGLQAAYRSVHEAMQRRPAPRGPWISVSSASELVLVGVNDATAKEVMALRDRFPGRNRLRGATIGTPYRIEEVYIYPLPHALADEPWRTILVRVYPEPEPEAAYYVEFWPKEMAAMVDPSGLPKRVLRPAGVRVKDGHVTDYRPPEKPMAQLGREDYERKALEAIEQVVAKSD
jgi:hypothetical protein